MIPFKPFLSGFDRQENNIHVCQVHATRFPRTSSLMLSLLVDAGCYVGSAVSCDVAVGNVGEDELEELVDRPGTTNGT